MRHLKSRIHRKQTVFGLLASTMALISASVIISYPAGASPVSPISENSGLSTSAALQIAIQPDTATNCVGTSGLDDTELCLNVNGSGLYVNTMDSTFYNRLLYGGITGHLEIMEPDGFALANTPDVNVPLGTFLYLDLTLDEDVPAGNYTAIFWHYIGAGDWVDYQSVPVDVHS